MGVKNWAKNYLENIVYSLKVSYIYSLLLL